MPSGSGGSATPSGSPPPPAPVKRVEASEIVEAVNAHPEGITLGALMRKFITRIDRPGSTTKSEWIQMVRQNANFGNDRLLRPKTT